MTAYKRLSLYDRRKIEEGLDGGLSFRAISDAIGRSPSTVSREVKENRTAKPSGKAYRHRCRELGRCSTKGLCESCPHPESPCAECKRKDCRELCAEYARQAACLSVVSPPWVCNSCKKRNYGCTRPGRTFYLAGAADAKASGIRSESRRGFDMGEERAAMVAALIGEGLARGLSPYEISVACAGQVGVSVSTMYRMVEAGVGGLANISLERKVGFKPRRHEKARPSTRHDARRSYGAFLALDVQRQAAAVEMDTMEGRKRDRQCLLTLYLPACHLQLPLLMPEQTSECTKAALRRVKAACPPELFGTLFLTVLTDNGGEMADEDGIDEILGGSLASPRLYYCDPRRSDQKARCEKNHSELRQILPKGRTPLDELDDIDIAVAASHANSNPRLSLYGLSPIHVFKSIFGKEGLGFLDALGICEIPPDRLMLKPGVLDSERNRRGFPPIAWQ